MVLGCHNVRTPSCGFSTWWMLQNTMKGFIYSQCFEAWPMSRKYLHTRNDEVIMKPLALGTRTLGHLHMGILKMADAQKTSKDQLICPKKIDHPSYIYIYIYIFIFIFIFIYNHSHYPAPHQQCHQDSMDARAITSLREGHDGAGKPRSAWWSRGIS